MRSGRRMSCGIRSVALYAPEDRDSVHRVKADEAYEIGEPGHPVSTYLDPEIAVALAQRVGADAIYPGYGFMSENPELARACAAAGLIFVGPPPEVLGLAGDKTRARTAAREAGVPVLDASEPVETSRGRDGGGREDRLPGVREGVARRRRARDASCDRSGAPGGVAGGSAQRGGGGLRRRHGLPRAGARAPAPHRGPAAGRRERRRRAPLRARLLAAAPPSEGDRDHAGAATSRRSCATASAPMPSSSPATSATSTRARSSSCSTRPTGATRSSR